MITVFCMLMIAIIYVCFRFANIKRDFRAAKRGGPILLDSLAAKLKCISSAEPSVFAGCPV